MKDWIIEAYRAGKPVEDIARKADLGKSGVYSILRRAGIPLRAPHRFGKPTPVKPPPMPKPEPARRALWDVWSMVPKGNSDDDR